MGLVLCGGWRRGRLCSSFSFSLSLPASVSAAPEPQGDSPHLEVQKGQFLQLVCASESQSPATLSWALEDRILSWSHPWTPGPLALVLTRVMPGDSGCYTCRAENGRGSQSLTLNLSVQCECDHQEPGFQKGRRKRGAGAGGQGPGARKGPGTPGRGG